MADKAIYSVDTVTSMSGTDKVYVNTGNNIKQITKDNLCGNAIREINDNLSSEISRAKEADEILKSRVDVITSLPEGSTTGDAELQDIRVKADGTTATSAGNAVREQINELKGDLANQRKLINILGKMTKGGYPNPYNQGQIEPKDDWYYSDFIPVNTRGNDSFIGNGVCFLCYFDKDKNFMASPNPREYANEGLEIPPTVYYIRLGVGGSLKNAYVYNCSIDDYNSYTNKYNIQHIADEFIEKSKLIDNYNLKNVLMVKSNNYYYNINYSASDKVVEIYSNGWITLEPILLKPGTYTYNNIPAYFSIFGDDEHGTNPERLSVDTSNHDGEFTLSANKYLWITLETNQLNNFELNTTIPTADYLNYLIDKKTNRIIHCGENQEFTKLKDAIEEGVKLKNTIIYVHSGVYDLISEFGSDYFQNLDDSSEKAGLWLYNDIHIIFDVNSKVICNYTGNNGFVNRFFSPFNSGDDTKHGGFIIENLNLECANVRYGVHDEHVNDRVPYVQKYINCNMKLDNTNTTNWKSAQCIGGGLGGYANIEIKDCIFDSTLVGGSNDTVAVSYHNARYVENAKSSITVSNCYFKNDNTIGAYSYGDTNEYTEYIISNNSLGKEIEERVYDGWHKNIDVFAWNNEIRS